MIVRDALAQLNALDGDEAMLSVREATLLAKQRTAVEQTLFEAMHELSRLSTYLNVYREMSASEPRSRRGSGDPTLGRAGTGLTQLVFERLAIVAIRRAGRPLESGEIVEEFKKLGHPIGGTHEIKTAYNRLWEGTRNKVLLHYEGAGYWIRGVTLTEAGLVAAQSAKAARRKRRGRSSNVVGRGTGRPHGRQKD